MTPFSSNESSDTPATNQDNEENRKMDETAISEGGLLHVLWTDDTPGNFDILYKRDGGHFDPTILNLSNNAGGSLFAAIAVSGKNVHVVWHDDTPGNSDIQYKEGPMAERIRLTINLSDNAGTSVFAAIAVSGNNCTRGMA